MAMGVLAGSGWAGNKARVEVSPNADFARYKTYQWLPTRILTASGVVQDDPTITPLVKDAINKQLAAKGLTEVQSGADLQVAAGVVTAKVPQLEAVVFGGPDMMFDTPIASMGRYNREGSLIVNLIDTKTKKSAWLAMVTESIDNKPGGGQKKIGPAAEKIFKKYPAGK